MCSDGNHVTDNLSDNPEEEPKSEPIARKGQLSKYRRFATAATTRTPSGNRSSLACLAHGGELEHDAGLVGCKVLEQERRKSVTEAGRPIQRIFAQVRPHAAILRAA